MAASFRLHVVSWVDKILLQIAYSGTTMAILAASVIPATRVLVLTLLAPALAPVVPRHEQRPFHKAMRGRMTDVPLEAM